MLASRLNCKNTYSTCTICRVNGLMRNRTIELNHCYYQETSISLCNDHIPIINKKYNLKEQKAIGSAIISITLIRQLKVLYSIPFIKANSSLRFGYTQSSSSVIDSQRRSSAYPLVYFSTRGNLGREGGNFCCPFSSDITQFLIIINSDFLHNLETLTNSCQV